MSSPPITHTCSLGIDIPTKKELIYNFYNDPEKLKDYLGVDSVKYLDLDDLKRIFENKIKCADELTGINSETP